MAEVMSVLFFIFNINFCVPRGTKEDIMIEMEPCIAAIATPIGTGGVSIIRLSGENVFSIAEKVFLSIRNQSLFMMEGYTATYGHFHENNQKIDDGVALVYKSPHSYTGEDVVELMCHGGKFVTEQILHACFIHGARPATAGEFTKRAFLNGKLSLSEAEAVMDILSSESKESLQMAEAGLEGKLSEDIREICQELLSLLGYFGAWFDYPDEDIEEISQSGILQQISAILATLERLEKSYGQGKLVRDGIATAIVGKPNVGKSTLMNYLAGEERSIVSDIPGTTRDVVEESVHFGKVTLRVMDTAGIHQTDDQVEKIGVERSQQKIQEAQLILALFDGSFPWDEEDISIAEYCKGKNVIPILTKTDIWKEDTNISGFFKAFDIPPISISARTGEGIELLENAIIKIVGLEEFKPYDANLLNERQYQCVHLAKESLLRAKENVETFYEQDLVSIDLSETLDALLELIGEKATEKTVDEVFSRFCVGK